MLGQLFTQDFLTTGVRETPAWEQVSDADLDAFIADLQAVYSQVVVDRTYWD